MQPRRCFSFFFFNDTATTEIYTLSLHDALPILAASLRFAGPTGSNQVVTVTSALSGEGKTTRAVRSEEHTSELQSLAYLVCRLLLEKKKKNHHTRVFHPTSERAAQQG